MNPDPSMDPDLPLTAGDGIWQQAAAGVQASLDADLRSDAYEVFVAEAARCRLVDRAGPARVTLRCGRTLEGELTPGSDEAVDDHLVLREGNGASWIVPVSAVVSLTGSRPGLRAEGDRVRRSLTSWLRETWSAGEPIRLLGGSGAWAGGRLDYVGADHVELVHGGERTAVPLTAVQAWQRG